MKIEHNKDYRINSIITDEMPVNIHDRKYEWFSVNGEMAGIDWIRVFNSDGSFTEYNTKHISQINYSSEKI